MNVTANRVSRAGLTIIELLVAIVVLGVGILGVAATLGVTATYMRISYLETQLGARALAKMEELLATEQDRLFSGELRRGGLAVVWQVRDGDPAEILLVASQRLGGRERADTLATLVTRR
jgi:type II secretory pathway component PulJ